MADFSNSLFDDYPFTNGSMNDGDQYPFNVSACPKKAILMYVSEELVQQLYSAAQNSAVIILFVFPVIILFGLLANFTFLLTVCRVREILIVSACPKKAILMYVSEELVQQLYSAAQNSAVIILFVFPVIILFGLLANFTFLFTVYRVREMRTVVKSGCFRYHVYIVHSCNIFLLDFEHR